MEEIHDVKVNFFTVAGAAGNQKKLAEKVMKETIRKWDKNVLNIEKEVITDTKNLRKIGGAGNIILAGTGGTSSKIIHIVETSGKPCLLLAHSKYNSLPSVLEALGVLKTKNIMVAVLYEDFSWRKIQRFIDIANTISGISQSRLGCIGNITRKPKNTLGVRLVQIPLQELVSFVKKTESEHEAQLVHHLKNIFGKVQVPDKALVDSARVYLGIKEIAKKYQLDAITIRCFDLLPYDFTACIGMALCNDAELVAGCEGDIDSTITMMLVKHLTGKPAFMANPAAVDPKRKWLTLAHCTIATQMIEPKRSRLLPHFESGKGVSIDGYLKKEDVTLVRANPDLGKMAVIPGKIVKSRVGRPDLCRTQVVVKVPNADKFVEKAIGNHHIVVLGNHVQEFLELCRFLNLEPVTL